MKTLSPMSSEAYEQYLKDAIISYAESNVSSGRWPKEGSVERSKAAYAELLPLGTGTPDNHLFEIKAGSGAQTVGMLWFAITNRNGTRSAFVYDVYIDPKFRKKGHATRAFKALEQLVREHDVSNIGLHVFSFNRGARALYEKLGYTATGINMIKHLGGARLRTRVPAGADGRIVRPRHRGEGARAQAAMNKDATTQNASASRLIDARIKELGGWRGETLVRVRALIKKAVPEVVEEWKWSVPVWSSDGILCTGEAYKSAVKLTFPKGASLKDPAKLFNSSLAGNARRAIDLHEGDKIDEAAFKALIRAAAALNNS